MSNRRLAYLSLEAPREGQAAYTHVHEIVKGLRRRGWDIHLFEPYYSDHNRVRPGTIGRIAEQMRLQWRLFKRRRDFDVIYVRGHFLAWPTAKLAKWCGLPIVHEINGPYEDIYISHKWTRVLAWFLPWLQRSQFVTADALITVTPELKTWVTEQIGEKRIEVIPNGANTDLFKPDAVSDLNLPKPYAVFFGGLARWQGTETMLEAVQSAHWPDEVALVIAGTGQQKELVEAIARKNKAIHYLGRLDYAQVPGVVAGALCGLVPKNARGDRENTGLNPLKVFETLACGTPAIVTDFPGQRDLVRDEDAGIIIPPEDASALARAVHELAQDQTRAKEMGKRGAEAVRKCHSWDARAEDTHLLLLNVVDKKSSGGTRRQAC